MTHPFTPGARKIGLYDPSFEKDSCGFGLIANMDDVPSHWLAATAVQSLARLTHRGAIAPDGKTGDGCGLLLKMPLQKWLYAMYLVVAARKGISSLQLSKELGITQKSAWFMLHRSKRGLPRRY